MVVGSEGDEVVFDVSDAEREIEATLGAKVRHGDFLREAKRVVEEREQDGDTDADAIGDRAGRGREDEWTRQVAVGRLMMLAKCDALEAEIVGPGDDVDRRRVRVGAVRAEVRGMAEVEVQRQLGSRPPVRGGRRFAHHLLDSRARNPSTGSPAALRRWISAIRSSAPGSYSTNSS